MRVLKSPLYITKSQLIAANDESIRVGFSGNLSSERLKKLPNHPLLVTNAWEHTATCDPSRKNIRLWVRLSGKENAAGVTSADLIAVVLDVTPDTYLTLLGNKLDEQTRRQLNELGYYTGGD